MICIYTQARLEVKHITDHFILLRLLIISNIHYLTDLQFPPYPDFR